MRMSRKRTRLLGVSLLLLSIAACRAVTPEAPQATFMCRRQHRRRLGSTRLDLGTGKLCRRKYLPAEQPASGDLRRLGVCCRRAWPINGRLRKKRTSSSMPRPRGDVGSGARCSPQATQSTRSASVGGYAQAGLGQAGDECRLWYRRPLAAQRPYHRHRSRSALSVSAGLRRELGDAAFCEPQESLIAGPRNQTS